MKFSPLIIIIVAFASIRQYGGSELSIDSFRTRRYTYWNMTLFDWRLTEAKYQPSAGSPIQAYLLRHGFSVDAGDAGSRWSLISHRGKGPSFYLHMTLVTGDWVTWSEHHPDLAKQLWPRVLRAAQSGERGPYIAWQMLGSVDRTQADSPALDLDRLDFWMEMADQERQQKPDE